MILTDLSIVIRKLWEKISFHKHFNVIKLINISLRKHKRNAYLIKICKSEKKFCLDLHKLSAIFKPDILYVRLCIVAPIYQLVMFAGNKYGHLKYLAIALNTTITPGRLSYKEGLPVYNEWENFVSNQVSCN